MPPVGFEPTTPVFERAKTVHSLDRAAAVIGSTVMVCLQVFEQNVASEAVSDKLASGSGRVKLKRRSGDLTQICDGFPQLPQENAETVLYIRP
jgi:hypothetical protein